MHTAFKNDKLIICVKPAGMPSQPDPSKDTDMMTAASDYLKGLGESGDLWLVHRLDRVVGGLIIFARDRRTASQLSALISTRDINKEYLAVIEGVPEQNSGEMRDLIYRDSVSAKAFIVKTRRTGVKEAFLEYSVLGSVDAGGKKLSLVRVRLGTGRFHQIRVQFSSRGFPIVGDGKYGSKDNRCLPALYAFRLSFNMPGSGEATDIVSYPDKNAYPWSLFQDELKNES